MAWLRLVIRVGVVWVASLVVAAVGMQLARRVVLATEPDLTAASADEKAAAVSFQREP